MSAFRPIAPSTPSDASAAPSPSRANQSGSGTSGGGSGSGGSGAQRKRRIPGHVAQIACSECRHARAKCDGVRPDPCSRCLGRNTTCIYEPHTKTHKDDLLREIEALREDNAGLQGGMEELQVATAHLKQKNQGLREASEWMTFILDVLGSDGHDQEIIRRLQTGESHHTIASWLGSQHEVTSVLERIPASQRNLVEVIKRVEGQCHGAGGLELPRDTEATEWRWTAVTSSQKLVRHLVDLYLAWVHPVHMLFGEVKFLESFQNNDLSYCSHALVSAICAMASHLLDDLGDVAAERDVDTIALRELFMDEARARLVPDEYNRITSVQAFGVMFLADLSSGKARKATGYLKAAVDSLKALDSDSASPEILEILTWGLYSLNTAWAGFTYQKPFVPEAANAVAFREVPIDQEDALWRFYRQPGDQQVPSRRSHALLTARSQVKLYQIVHEAINVFSETSGKATAQSILRCYARFLAWRDELPSPMDDIDVDVQPLPHVLYLHIQYHTALVHLLNPLLQCDMLWGLDHAKLKQIVVFHGRRGLKILEQSDRLYTCRYQMPLIAFCMLHLSDALIRHSPNYPPATEVVAFCLNLLLQSCGGFAISGTLQEMFSRTAIECNVSMPENFKDLMSADTKYGLDEILDTCTRLTYVQPTDQYVHNIVDSIGMEWPEEWERVMSSSNAPSRRRSVHDNRRAMHISSLLND